MRTVAALAQTTEKPKQKSLVQKGGEIIAELPDDDMQVTEAETGIEVNFALMKFRQGAIEENSSESSTKLGEGTERGTEKVTENQRLILESIAQNPHVTSEELAEIVKIRADKIRVNIAKLKAKDLLERVGPDKGGYWKVKT